MTPTPGRRRQSMKSPIRSLGTQPQLNRAHHASAPLVFLLALCLLGTPAFAQPASAAHVTLDRVTSAKALPNGLEFHSGPAILQITALRDDVIRVRAGAAGTLPED